MNGPFKSFVNTILSQSFAMDAEALSSAVSLGNDLTPDT